MSIGIEFECHLASGNKPLHLFEKQLKNNKFRAWRFIGDSKYKKHSINNMDDYSKNMVDYSNSVNELLNKHQIPKPTAKQMSIFYHED